MNRIQACSNEARGAAADAIVRARTTLERCGNRVVQPLTVSQDLASTTWIDLDKPDEAEEGNRADDRMEQGIAHCTCCKQTRLDRASQTIGTSCSFAYHRGRTWVGSAFQSYHLVVLIGDLTTKLRGKHCWFACCMSKSRTWLATQSRRVSLLSAAFCVDKVR